MGLDMTRYATVELPNPRNGKFFEAGGHLYTGERGVVRDGMGDCMSARVARLVAGALIAAADAAEHG